MCAIPCMVYVAEDPETNRAKIRITYSGGVLVDVELAPAEGVSVSALFRKGDEAFDRWRDAHREEPTTVEGYREAWRSFMKLVGVHP